MAMAGYRLLTRRFNWRTKGDVMKKIISFVIVAAVSCLYLFTVPPASAEGHQVPWQVCINQCKGKSGAELRECFQRCAPPKSEPPGDGGGVLGGVTEIDVQCNVCTSNCKYEEDQFACCSTCLLLFCGENARCP